MMYNFIGEHSHTIDAKSRVIIPAKFREALGEQFVLTQGLDGCLTIYPLAEWEKFQQQLNQLPRTNKQARIFRRFFTAKAAMCELDKQGRILVPAGLREYANLEKDVVITGNDSNIEIWNKEKWEEMNEDIDIETVTEELHEMGIMF